MKSSQNISPFPTGDELLVRYQKTGFDFKSYTSFLPPSLKALAFSLCEAQMKVNGLRNQYDRLSLAEQSKFRELSRNEALKKRILEKEVKVEKERLKLAKKERGWRKAHYIKTGELFEETEKRLIAEFKLFVESHK